MPQSLSKVILHIVFSTKYRKPSINNIYKNEMHVYIATVCRSMGSNAIRVGGIEDHIHIAATLPRTLAISKLVEGIKKSSSRWYKEKDMKLADFAWQAGYGVFSVGESQISHLVHYIDSQEEHHKRKSFQNESLELFQKYNVEYDERYVWD